MEFKVLILAIGVCMAYDLKCPDSAQWNLRARALCPDTSKYYCLPDELKKQFTENCTQSDYQRAGLRVIIRGGWDLGYCSEDLYQPAHIIYYTNLTSDCILRKSLCNEEGQVLYNNGSSNDDVSCACDYTKGYAFVIKPKNFLHCMPSQEDCSCYKKPCYNASYALNSDYRCILGAKGSVQPDLEITTKINIKPSNQSQFHSIESYKLENAISRSRMCVILSILVALLICGGALMLTVVCLYEEQFYNFLESFAVLLFLEKDIEDKIVIEGQDVILQILTRIKTKVHWMKDGIILKNNERLMISSCGKRHTLRISNASLDDFGVYQVTIGCLIRTTRLQITAKQVLIPKLNSEQIKKLDDHVKTGSERRRFIRVVIIGKQGVGKTCLLRRLLGEPIEDVTSTDGVDIDIRKLKIRLDDGCWIPCEVTDRKKELLARIKKALNSEASDVDYQYEQRERNGLDWRSDTETTETGKDSSDKLEVHEELKQERQTVSKNVAPEKTIDSKTPNEVLATKPTIVKDTLETKESKPEHQVTNFLSKRVTDALAEFLPGIEELEVSIEEFAECGFWDFAGEKRYYATHQIFLNPDSLYILVSDIMDEIRPMSNETDFDSIGGHVDFWLDTIDAYGTDEKTVKDKHYLDPPVLLVYTGTDKCKNQSEMTAKKKTVEEKVQTVLENEKKRHHLRKIFFVSNTEPLKEDFENIKNAIFEYGKMLQPFKKSVPLKWIKLEMSLDIIRQAGVNVISWEDMLELTLKCNIESEDEIYQFLKYQHQTGDIIFFEVLKNYIILSQQWLSKLFRCFVTNKVDNIEFDMVLSENWIHFRKTGELKDELFDELVKKEPELRLPSVKQHLLEVMKIFHIVTKPSTVSDGQIHEQSSYYMPCMIRRSDDKMEEVLKKFKAVSDCFRSPWLCFECNFLPFAFFNHALVYYIGKYTTCLIPSEDDKLAIYHGMAVFNLDDRQYRKLFLCFTKNTIAMQIWDFDLTVEIDYSALLNELLHLIRQYKKSHQMKTIICNVKGKCAEGDIYKTANRKSFEQLQDEDDSYYCDEHPNRSTRHRTQELFQTWFKDRFQILQLQGGFQQADRNVIVQQEDLNNSIDYKLGQPRFEFSHHFQILRGITDGIFLDDGRIVICFYGDKALQVFTVDGNKKDWIPVKGKPWNITAFETSTIAVILRDSPDNIALFNIDTHNKISSLNVPELLWGISSLDNKLVVGCKDSIQIIAYKTEHMIRKISTCSMPVYLHVFCDTKACFIYAIVGKTLRCYTSDGQTVFIKEDLPAQPRRITSLHDGSLYVRCVDTKVYHCSPNGRDFACVTPEKLGGDYDLISYNHNQQKLVCGSSEHIEVFNHV